MWQFSIIVFSAEEKYAYMEICQQFVSKSFFFYKSQFFRSVGNVIQQIKKVSPNIKDQCNTNPG